MNADRRETVRVPILYCALAAFIMAYGWGYRGTVGHEAGAMVPGALLGLALCLASGRLDWHRRAAVGGLFAAVGWAWGGSFSYMEQTMYILSDSFPDVLYGYTMIFFLGAMWAGIGGGVFGLALTESRSELERLARPFTAICAVYFAVYVYLFFEVEHAEFIETITVRTFHDGDWVSATIALGVSAVYWVLVPKDRPATSLFLFGALAWWIGYGGLTYFGNLRLAPNHRSESWSGVLGILIVVVAYLSKRNNRAALMLCLYGIVGGGLAYSLAVFIRHPIAAKIGPFSTGNWPSWRTAEDFYGFFMGIAIAIGALRLLRGGLAPAKEDTPCAPLDVYAAFVVLIALPWINFRRHAEPWLEQWNKSDVIPFLGVPMWAWYVFGGAIATMPLAYVLIRYLRGDRQLVPQSAFGKGLFIAVVLLWATIVGHSFDDIPSVESIHGHLMLWVPAAIATALLLSFTPLSEAQLTPDAADVAASDPKWRIGPGYWAVWGIAPVCLISFTALGLSMQHENLGRKRFGPDAYWHQSARLVGTWNAVARAESLTDPGKADETLPIKSLRMYDNRDVVATFSSGETSDAHRWSQMNHLYWLDWYEKIEQHDERAKTALQFQGDRLYVSWPPHNSLLGYVVFERADD
jgi:hypothetical protein